MNVNKVILVGRLTRDPEIRTTPGGQSVATLSMATNSFWTDKAGSRQERTEFHNVVLWGRLAEVASQYLTKGQECFIEGRMQTRQYTAKDGSERRVTEVIGENMQLGSRAQGSSQGGSTQRSSAPQMGATAGAPAASKRDEEEEIPTINLDDEKDEIRIEDVPF
ncbi:MAG: single-stranded DNA-binding protein [Patescibacteria group bacterium]